MSLLFASPSEADFKQICQYIHAFELDDRELKKEEFCAAFLNDRLLGFGRLRKHPDCIELCSLGVVESHRHQHIASAITGELLKKEPHSIYVVCIIPDFFSRFGFEQVATYPPSIQQKLEYCRQALSVPEPYVAMCLQR
jgi:N-acetylglutamate synthase-like GNAT family acetyltransferase